MTSDRVTTHTQKIICICMYKREWQKSYRRSIYYYVIQIVSQSVSHRGKKKKLFSRSAGWEIYMTLLLHTPI